MKKKPFSLLPMIVLIKEKCEPEKKAENKIKDSLASYLRMLAALKTSSKSFGDFWMACLYMADDSFNLPVSPRNWATTKIILLKMGLT